MKRGDPLMVNKNDKVRTQPVHDKTTENAHAYTPGLKVKDYALIEKSKRLPISGEVMVEEGQIVDFDTIVARTRTPGTPHLVNVAASLNIEPPDIPEFMTKKEGDNVSKGEIIAEMRLLFGLVRNTAKSPVDGYIDKISSETGRVTVREPAQPVELKANMRGSVVKIMPNEGAVIRANGSYIQGILGIGGEANGELVVAVERPDMILDREEITPEHKGKVLLGGAIVTGDALKMSVERGVSGIISGGIDFCELCQFMGETLGVAITGEEKLGLTLIITEGFGKMRMSPKTFNILRSLEGRKVAIDGTTQIRAGVIRPEIICPREEATQASPSMLLETGMRPGTKVRIIQQPYFGQFGTVINLPTALRKIETESLVRVVEIESERGESVVLPRANVEIIEE